MNLITFIAESAADQSAQAPAGAGWGSILSMIIPLVLMVLIFYFLIIRPEKKRN